MIYLYLYNTIGFIVFFIWWHKAKTRSQENFRRLCLHVFMSVMIGAWLCVYPDLIHVLCLLLSLTITSLTWYHQRQHAQIINELEAQLARLKKLNEDGKELMRIQAERRAEREREHELR